MDDDEFIVTQKKSGKSIVKINNSHLSQLLPLKKSSAPLKDLPTMSKYKIPPIIFDNLKVMPTVLLKDIREYLGHNNFLIEFAKGTRVYAQTVTDQKKSEIFGMNNTLNTTHWMNGVTRGSRNWSLKPIRVSTSMTRPTTSQQRQTKNLTPSFPWE